MSAPNADSVLRRKVIAEYQEVGCWLVLDDAQAGEYPTAESVVRMVVYKDRSAARRGVSTITTVDWRNVPDGFVPPEPAHIDGSGAPS